MAGLNADGTSLSMPLDGSASSSKRGKKRKGSEAGLPTSTSAKRFLEGFGDGGRGYLNVSPRVASLTKVLQPSNSSNYATDRIINFDIEAGHDELVSTHTHPPHDPTQPPTHPFFPLRRFDLKRGHSPYSTNCCERMRRPPTRPRETTGGWPTTSSSRWRTTSRPCSSRSFSRASRSSVTSPWSATVLICPPARPVMTCGSTVR